MAYLHTVAERNATGEVAEVYRDIRARLGDVPAAFRGLSTDPVVLRETWRAYPYAMEYGDLGRAERQIVALAVSRANACRYGMDTATQFLVEMGMQPAQISALFREDTVRTPPHDALIRLAERVTRIPDEPAATEVDAMLAAGFSEQEIREAATVAVWSNLLDRLVDGMGVPHGSPPRRRALGSLRTAAYDFAARIWRADEIPTVAARQDGGAGETAVVILKQMIRQLEPIPRTPPRTFTHGIDASPRSIDAILIQRLRDDGWDDLGIFRAAVVLAGRRAMRCWGAVVSNLGDPLSGPLRRV